ncbi:MAG: hypothetical protein OEY63_06860, partial [Gemmatimonadota bacterium]|nr:hypothetical protein [Gemmatimonadota bacterium]
RLTEFRYQNRDLEIHAAEIPFEARGRQFDAGTFIIHAEEHGPDFRNTMEGWAAEFGFTAYGVADRRFEDVPTHEVAAPRIAIVHTWQNTQSEGWLRIGFDQYGVPFDYISVHEVRDDQSLNDKYDVIIMGPTSLNALSVMTGITGDEAIPWRRSDITPNIGANDETDDMRGGLELEGIVHLKEFVENGGTFITLSSSSSIPIHFGIVNGISIASTPNLWARGGVFRANLTDQTSPLAYGFDENLGVYFNTAPVFSTRPTGGFQGFGGGSGAGTGNAGPANTTARRTGRGGVGDADIVQGRPRNMGQAGVDAFRESGGEDAPNFFQESQSSNDNRTIFSFAPVDQLLVSGGIRNAGQLAGTPAMVDAPVGAGHVILFSFNPFWRGQTVGSYALVFNALLHHGNLGAGEGQ